MNDINKFINYLEISDFCNAQHMLNNNFDINSVDYNKYNLLMMLINENIKAIDPFGVLNFLINNNINMNAIDYNENTILMMLPFKNKILNTCLEQILVAGTDPNMKNIYGITPIMNLCVYNYLVDNTEIINMINLMVKYNADINAQNNNQQTSLMLLLSRSNLKNSNVLIKYFILEPNINLNIYDDKNFTALMYAAQIQYDDYYKYINILIIIGIIKNQTL